MSAIGLVSIVRGEVPPAAVPRDPDACASSVAQLAAYFSGRLRELDLQLDLSSASAFDAAVWRAAREIPYGQTSSYGEVALIAGRPGAARAVGGSMARCPLTPVVPCHRVIHADGSLGGWGGQAWIKRWLLDLERTGG